MKLHSFSDIITNSSTEIFVVTGAKSEEDAKNRALNALKQAFIIRTGVGYEESRIELYYEDDYLEEGEEPYWSVSIPYGMLDNFNVDELRSILETEQLRLF